MTAQMLFSMFFSEKDLHLNAVESCMHKMYTYESNKKYLSVYDDKRHIKDDGIHNLPYGHKDIPTRN